MRNNHPLDYLEILPPNKEESRLKGFVVAFVFGLGVLAALCGIVGLIVFFSG